VTQRWSWTGITITIVAEPSPRDVIEGVTLTLDRDRLDDG
jgi:hypothetical protein